MAANTEIRFAPKDHSHDDKYISWEWRGNGDILRTLKVDDGDEVWLRTTKAGFLPYYQGDSTLGNLQEPFKMIFAKDFIEDGTYLSSKYIQKGVQCKWLFVQKTIVFTKQTFPAKVCTKGVTQQVTWTDKYIPIFASIYWMPTGLTLNSLKFDSTSVTIDVYNMTEYDIVGDPQINVLEVAETID